MSDSWIEIDKELRSLWKASGDSATFYKEAMRKYKWEERQAMINAQHIEFEFVGTRPVIPAQTNNRRR